MTSKMSPLYILYLIVFLQISTNESDARSESSACSGSDGYQLCTKTIGDGAGGSSSVSSSSENGMYKVSLGLGTPQTFTGPIVNGQSLSWIAIYADGTQTDVKLTVPMGVKPENVKFAREGDMLTISGPISSE